MRIITYPNPILQTSAQEINLADFNVKKLRKLIKNMVKTMRKADGVGLAAPQVGYGMRLCVIKQTENDLVLINPMIATRSKKTAIMEEGCLSLPNVKAKVKRAKWIKIKTQNIKGEFDEFEAGDLLARVIQHEIDHLNGILIIDKPA